MDDKDVRRTMSRVNQDAEAMDEGGGPEVWTHLEGLGVEGGEWRDTRDAVDVPFADGGHRGEQSERENRSANPDRLHTWRFYGEARSPDVKSQHPRGLPPVLYCNVVSA